MKILKINDLKLTSESQQPGYVACWGFFDGWHLGHQLLIKTLKEQATAQDLQTMVISFQEKPQSIIKNIKTPILLSHKDKIAYLENMGIDIYCELQFNHEMAKKEAQVFIDFLIAMNVKTVVVDEAVRFGFQGQGDLNLLNQSILKVVVASEATKENIKVSSTLIKSLIQDGNLELANELLGHKDAYTLSGTVVDGLKEGRKLGFRTANLALDDNYTIPAFGVYYSLTEFKGKWLPSLTVVIERDKKALVETYIFDFDQEIYGQKIKVQFLDLLRSNIVFSDIEILVQQIKDDVEKAKLYFKKIGLLS